MSRQHSQRQQYHLHRKQEHVARLLHQPCVRGSVMMQSDFENTLGKFNSTFIVPQDFNVIPYLAHSIFDPLWAGLAGMFR